MDQSDRPFADLLDRNLNSQARILSRHTFDADDDRTSAREIWTSDSGSLPHSKACFGTRHVPPRTLEIPNCQTDLDRERGIDFCELFDRNFRRGEARESFGSRQSSDITFTADDSGVATECSDMFLVSRQAKHRRQLSMGSIDGLNNNKKQQNELSLRFVDDRKSLTSTACEDQRQKPFPLPGLFWRKRSVSIDMLDGKRTGLPPHEGA
jgi:hypothetical protein